MKLKEMKENETRRNKKLKYLRKWNSVVRWNLWYIWPLRDETSKFHQETEEDVYKPL